MWMQCEGQLSSRARLNLREQLKGVVPRASRAQFEPCR